MNEIEFSRDWIQRAEFLSCVEKKKINKMKEPFSPSYIYKNIFQIIGLEVEQCEVQLFLSSNKKFISKKKKKKCIVFFS